MRKPKTRLPIPLFAAATIAALLSGVAAPAQAAPLAQATTHYVTKTYTQTLNAKALLKGVDGLGVGSGSTFKIQKYVSGIGGCYVSKNVLECTGYDKAYMDKQPDSGSPLRISPRLTVPQSVLKAAAGGKVQMRVSAKFTKVDGSVVWDYGTYGTMAQATEKHAGTRTLKAVALDTTPAYGGPVYAPLDFMVPYYKHVSIRSVSVKFIYRVKA